MYSCGSDIDLDSFWRGLNMIIFIDLTLLSLSIYVALSYLYFVSVIRKNDTEVVADNFFILNFMRVYGCYVEVCKRQNKSPWLFLLLHLTSVILLTVLGVIFEGN